MDLKFSQMWQEISHMSGHWGCCFFRRQGAGGQRGGRQVVMMARSQSPYGEPPLHLARMGAQTGLSPCPALCQALCELTHLLFLVTATLGGWYRYHPTLQM